MGEEDVDYASGAGCQEIYQSYPPRASDPRTDHHQHRPNINYVVTDRKSRQAQAKALHMIQSTNKTIKATWKLMTR